MERWNGRVALVTGSSSGIGSEICRDLLKHGMEVVGCARNVDRIKAISEEPEVKAFPGTLHPMKCDLSIESDILAMFGFIRKKFGRIDVCVNNAGMAADCPLMSGKTEDWRMMFNLNVLALCICTRESLQLMKEKKIDDGQIIHISSVVGHVVIDMDVAFYAGTKFMVNALTEGLRQELRGANTHIRIASISPGFVQTEFVRRWTKGDLDREKEYYESMQCLQPTDVSTAVISVLQTPPHVDINNILVRPTEQKV